MMDRNSTRTTDDQPTLSRRGLLAAGAGAGTLALAGCSQIVDFLAGLVLEDVNVFNGVSKQVSGSIVVRDPSDEVVLEDSFSLAANSEGADPSNGPGNESNNSSTQSTSRTDDTPEVTPLQSGNESGNESGNQSGNESNKNEDVDGGVTYSNVFTESGSYTVSVGLDEGSEIWGRRESEQTVEVNSTGDEHIMVFLGAADADQSKRDGPFLITAINDFSDLDGIGQGDVGN